MIELCFGSDRTEVQLFCLSSFFPPTLHSFFLQWWRNIMIFLTLTLLRAGTARLQSWRSAVQWFLLTKLLLNLKNPANWLVMFIAKELPNFNFTECWSCFSLQCMKLFDINYKHTDYSEITYCQVQDANSGMIWQKKVEKP